MTNSLKNLSNVLEMLQNYLKFGKCHTFGNNIEPRFRHFSFKIKL